MIKRIGGLAIAWTLAAFLAAGAAYPENSEVFLNAARSETVRIPLSLLYVAAPAALAKHNSETRTVLEGDLRRSQVFRIVLPPPFPELAAGQPPGPDAIQRAGRQDIQAAVWIALSGQGGDLTLEGRVFDGQTGQMVLGKRYVGQAGHLRALIHRFADDIVYQYTGERGISQTRIVFTSTLTGGKELYLMDYDGYNVRRLTNDRSLNLSPKWSSDGNWISYTSYRGGTPMIYTLEPATGRIWKTAGYEGLNISPAWSPAGDRLAFAATMDGPTQIYTVNREGKGLRRLTVDGSDNLSPSWSPTGDHLVFTSNRGGGPQIYMMSAGGTDVRRLTFAGDYNTSPAWSPKGTAIAYVCRVDGRLRICAISPDGEQPVQLTDGPGEDESPAWSPDGKHIVFSSTREGKGDLYRMNADGMEMERLTFNGARNNGPSWSP